ncbi:Hypothetical protein NTJ_02046 [Nesidiocoris tenuis]|uniref:Carbohydrate kinase PfkB domain-containing protein n=1 Tax=Nesidiocoris tenuis TaxID=355587 RepID=A0ABN7AD11_9HEMI|nr:Hypothetical protein NTJ_02046 [Nesidiocoris tenuis]
MSPRILCVGLVCFDVIQTCSDYPKEDSDQRSLDCYWSRGGNASNNCTVLSLLGAQCSFIGHVANNLFWEYAKRDFEKYGIDVSKCIIREGRYDFPLSTVITNAQNGSRTIIHSNKNLPETTADEFLAIDISQHSWIHFEGRNPSELFKILTSLANHPVRNRTVSVELEKTRDGFIELAPHADTVFISKDFAKYHGWTSMEAAIDGMKKHIQPGATVICAWGENGAIAYQDQVGVVKAPSYPPDAIVDTLGAGDTFLAATIFYLSRGKSLQESIDFGCRIAGAKVGARGYDIVEKAYNQLQRKPS